MNRLADPTSKIRPMKSASIQQPTIAAIATAMVSQQGSVGIVRLSGATAIDIAKQLFVAAGKQTWESHRVLYGHVQNPQTSAIVDEALLLMMVAPRSYTREDVVEFHCHGGTICVQQVLQLCLTAGANLAQPGDFTLRAFLNGRIDLTQAESISELVGARSPAAASAALAGLQGKLRKPIQQVRDRALDILAEIEAQIDFADDLPAMDVPGICGQIDRLSQTLKTILATADRGELLRTGLKIAIVGHPNVGKSSLLNALSRTDRAIVTDLPGTTRDVVESNLVIGGMPIQVLDTAGIRETTDRVEQIGVARSKTAAQQADLVILTMDGQQGWTDAETAIYQQVHDKPLILAINKMDLITELPWLPADLQQYAMVALSALSQEGIDRLEAKIVEIAQAGTIGAANLDLAINQRQAAALTQATSALQRVQETIADDLPWDFWTIDLRAAIKSLGEVTGEELVESVLDRIFSRFCIGK
jgi:tRNA modification GTPase